MEANEFIKRNDRLLPLMNELISEIEQMERFRLLYQKSDNLMSSGDLQRLTKQVSRSKGRVEFINLAWDENCDKDPRKYTSAFVLELHECIDEIPLCYQRVAELKRYIVK